MDVILVVSHDRGSRESLNRILSRDFTVLEATTAARAVAIASNEPVDVVFLDAHLPDGKGRDLLAQMKRTESDLAVVLVNATRGPEATSAAVESGTYDAIASPLVAEEVLSIARRAMERQKLLREIRLLRSQLSGAMLSRPTTPAEPGGVHATGTAAHAVANHRVFFREALRKLSKAASSVFDLERLPELVVEAVADIFDVNRAALLLPQEGTDHFVVQASVGLDEQIVRRLRFASGGGVIGWLRRNSQVLLTGRVLELGSPQQTDEIVREMDLLHASLVFPLMAKDKMVGALSLGNRVTGKAFEEEDLQLLLVAANHLGTIIDNALLCRKLSLQTDLGSRVLENIHSGLLAMDDQGKITVFNSVAENVLGISAEEVLGREIQKAGSSVADVMLRTLRDGRTFVRHEIINPVTKSPIGLSTSAIRDSSGQVAGAIMVFSDLSSLKRQEDRLGDSEKDAFWARVAKCVAQEVNTSLVSINTFTQLFEEKHEDEEFRQDFFRFVSKEVDRLTDLVERLKQFSEPVELSKEELDIHTLIDRALSPHKKMLASKKVKVKKRYAENVPKVRLDSKLVEQAFDNVIVNGIEAVEDATPDGGGAITITTEYLPAAESGDNKKGLVEVAFGDSGAGISDEHLDELCSPFFTTKARSLGLGLAITDKIIRSHRGSIIASSTEGKGSSFKVRLPVEQE